MGIVCEFYRVSDTVIDKIIADPVWGNEYLEENYSLTDGKFHVKDDTHFYTDKGWAIARYLLKQADKTDTLKQLIEGNLIDKNNYEAGQFIKSENVKEIHSVLDAIDTMSTFTFYNEEEMIAQHVYRAGELTNKNFIAEHIDTIKRAFERAAECNDGIIILHM